MSRVLCQGLAITVEGLRLYGLGLQGFSLGFRVDSQERVWRLKYPKEAPNLVTLVPNCLRCAF